MNRHIIIVAGGTGTRMLTNTVKQFLMIKGLPLVWWTLRRFQEATPDAPITLVLHDSLFEEFRQLEEKHGPSGAFSVVRGGANRFNSVFNALVTLPDEGLVSIHDAVRPLPSIDIIRKSLDTAALHGGAIPVIELKDSIRQISGINSIALNRSDYLLVQTPQSFDLSLIKPAYSVNYSPSFTDDASVFEAAGHRVHHFLGSPINIKVTTPEDLVIARALLGP
jgi:2-C-methyl-D-erythritol 4-phosphate cytidylyltransferase